MPYNDYTLQETHRDYSAYLSDYPEFPVRLQGFYFHHDGPGALRGAKPCVPDTTPGIPPDSAPAIRTGPGKDNDADFR